MAYSRPISIKLRYPIYGCGFESKVCKSLGVNYCALAKWLIDGICFVGEHSGNKCTIARQLPFALKAGRFQIDRLA
jgi:hypothetical protein